MTNPDLLPSFDDADVQIAYRILCQVDENTPPGDEHWEGFTARRIIAALRRLASSEDAVKVRELEWHPHPAGGEQALAAGLGLYRVHRDGSNWYLVPDHMGEGGKAAAQADYEARIRSALITASPADAGRRPTAEDVLERISTELGVMAESLTDGPSGFADGIVAAIFAGTVRANMSTDIEALTAPVATTKSDGVPDRESWWLIERIGTGLYTKSPDALPALTNDPWRAFRFATEREAHEARLRLVSLRDECKVTEHIFINKYDHPSDPSPTRSDVTVEELVSQVRSIIGGIYGVGMGDLAGEHQNKSIERAADKIVALLETHEIGRM